MSDEKEIVKVLTQQFAEIKETVKLLEQKIKGKEKICKTMTGVIQKELQIIWQLCAAEIFIYQTVEKFRAMEKQKSKNALKAHETDYKEKVEDAINSL